MKKINKRIKVLFLFERYGQISETYKDEEITGLLTHPEYSEMFDINILGLVPVNLHRETYYEYYFLDVQSPDFVQNLDEFMKIINPDIFHTHYLHNAQMITNFS